MSNLSLCSGIDSGDIMLANPTGNAQYHQNTDGCRTSSEIAKDDSTDRNDSNDDTDRGVTMCDDDIATNGHPVIPDSLQHVDNYHIRLHQPDDNHSHRVKNTQPSSRSARRSTVSPPDGGWGWIIVLASFLCNAMVDGLCSTFGVFFPRLLDTYGEGRGKTALVGSLMAGGFLSSGLLASTLVNYWGCRIVTITGALLTTIALILGSLSPSVDILILTFGVMGGVGLGLMYLPAMTLVGHYFDHRRPLATGIACSGAGIGMVVLPPIVANLLYVMDWRNTMFTLGGISMQCVVLGALMRPLDRNQQNTKCSVKIGKLSKNPIQEISHLPPKNGYCEIKEKCQNSSRCNTARKINNPNTGNEETFDSDDEHVDADPAKEFRLQVSKSLCILGGSMAALPCPDHLLHLSKDAMTSSCNTRETLSGRGPLKTLQYKPIHNSTGYTPLATKSCEHIHKRPYNQDVFIRSGKLKNGFRDIDDGRVSASCGELTTNSTKPCSNKPLLLQNGGVCNVESRSLQNLSLDPAKTDAADGSDIACRKHTVSLQSRFKEVFDINLLRNGCFLIICGASVVIQIGYFVPIVFVSNLAISLGIAPPQASMLISIIGICNTVGRFIGGLLGNLSWVKTLHLNNISLIIAGVLTILVGPICSSYILLVTYAALYGFFIGFFVPLTTIFLVDYLGLERLNCAFGFLSLVKGLSTMAGPPIAGALLDATSGYDTMFYFSGAMFVSAGLLFYLLPVVDKLQSRSSSRRLTLSDCELDTIDI